MPLNPKYRDINGHIMAVWDPNDKSKKTTAFSQIKKLIFALYRGLKTWVVRFIPGFQSKMAKHVGQWYWTHDWLGRKCKAWYFGPRLDWMFLDKDEKNDKRKIKKIRRNIKQDS